MQNGKLYNENQLQTDPFKKILSSAYQLSGGRAVRRISRYKTCGFEYRAVVSIIIQEDFLWQFHVSVRLFTINRCIVSNFISVNACIVSNLKFL